MNPHPVSHEVLLFLFLDGSDLIMFSKGFIHDVMGILSYIIFLTISLLSFGITDVLVSINSRKLYCLFFLSKNVYKLVCLFVLMLVRINN